MTGGGRALLIFTDLDGTLLDPDTYDWRPAAAALEALRRAGAHLIPATSKTWAEVEPLLGRLPAAAAAIVENGAAIYGREAIPAPEGATSRPGGWVLVRGPSRDRILGVLAALERRYPGQIRPLSSMSDAELQRRTGLPDAALGAARQRQHSEPFLAEGVPPGELRAAAAAEGLAISSGGRFLHLADPGGKGAAARRLIAAVGREGQQVVSAGLGDSANDRSLLQAVDLPVLMPRPDGTHDPAILGVAPNLCLASRPGPGGWAEAVMGLLRWWIGWAPGAPAGYG